jgi:hypothetical protein
MKILYTNQGMMTEASYRQLKECGVDVQVAGVSGVIEGVIEGGPSTRRAARDAAIDADMADFSNLDDDITDADEDELFIDGTVLDQSVQDAIRQARKFEENPFNKDFTEDENDHLSYKFSDSSDEEWFLESQNDRDEEIRLLEKIRSIIEECGNMELKEALQHSQTAFTDMNPSVVKEQVKEVAPPGMEKVVLSLKKKFGEKSSRPYQIAWAMYNKKRGKTSRK